MGDRQPVRDRTLILRVLVPGLETRLRDKMKEEIEDYTASPPPSRTKFSSTSSSSQNYESNSAAASVIKETLLNLDGVTCEPTQENSTTLWNFHCDGATYPARLVNMPCPIELHKTHDHAMYFKCCNISQMLIVYEDSMALDEADAIPKSEGYPSYYHSGLTAPLKRVVERKFALREFKAVPPPRAEVADVENELHDIMCKISKEAAGGGKRNPKVPSLASVQHANKIMEEIVEEVVDYEPWMDDYGREPSGVEIDAYGKTAEFHPEIWLTPEQIDDIKTVERIKKEEADALLKKKQEAFASARKEKKKKKRNSSSKESEVSKPSPAVAAPAHAHAHVSAARAAPSPKKGIASSKKKKEEKTGVDDDITKAALASFADDDLDGEGIDELGFNFDDMDGIIDFN